MSARNLTAFALSAAVGVVSGRPSLVTLGASDTVQMQEVAHMQTGVYIFRPAIEEQQKSSEFWRDPG